MIQDYSGFYYNVSGDYENIVYYIKPGEEQKLYMIRKYDEMIDTNAVLKSIESGFNGYNYEIYGITLLSKPFDNPEMDEEICVGCTFEDFSNRQEFDGIIIINESMPLYSRLYQYLLLMTADLPVIVETADPRNVLQPSKPVQQPVQQQPVEQVEQPVQEPVQQQPIEQPQEEVVEEIIEEPAPKNFNEQLKTPQQQAFEDSRTLAFQIVQANEENEVQDNNNQ